MFLFMKTTRCFDYVIAFNHNHNYDSNNDGNLNFLKFSLSFYAFIFLVLGTLIRSILIVIMNIDNYNIFMFY